MGVFKKVGDAFANLLGGLREQHELYELGCQVMGPSRNPRSTTERAARLAAGRKELERREAQRQQRFEGRWTSRYRSATGKIDVLLDKDGNPTNAYPHVHIAYNEQDDEIAVMASLGPHRRAAQEILPGDASGNQVNEAVRRMSRMLP